MRDDKFTRITVEQSDRKLVWEVPYEDVSGDEMVEGFASLMYGLTFLPCTITKCMKEYAEEHFTDYNEDNGKN